METIPLEIRQFVEQYVDCIDQLEAIRILANDVDRSWDVAQLADVVQSEPDSMTSHLRELEVRGLIGRTPKGKCYFRPATPELASMTRAFLLAYLQRPVSVIRLVYARHTLRRTPENQRCNQALSTDSICSGSTGLDK